MPEHIPYLRIFISSPSDVTDERKIALDVIKRLPNRPALRDRVAFRIIAWDEIGADTPMRATLTPQEAINQGLPTPSQCDIVVVLFWSRMGTPFVHTDGKEYLSGTHWELLDALNSTRAETLIYRRTEEKRFTSDDKDGSEQNERVKAFFKSDLFSRDGRPRGINRYASPDEFRQKFETHFEDRVVWLLHKIESEPARPADPVPAALSRMVTVEREAWPAGKSPFPGLRAFTKNDADIFFGRGRETDLLVRRIAAERFLAVVGASGSGKSSLVGAGLIPRLDANAVSGENVGSKDWFIVTLKPGKAPFEALAAALMDTIPALGCDDPIGYPDRLERLIESLSKAPDRLAKTVTHALKGEKAWAEALIVIDQFEELFKPENADDAGRFAAMLMAASTSDKLRVVVTMRDDFFHRANAYQDLSELLQSGSFPLTTPRRDALRRMIERPAERAGLEFEPGLVEQILDDTGDEPGGLALMAYALDELYKLARGRITFAHYRALGGVKGAIGSRAEHTFAALPGDEATRMQTLQRVFHRLVDVDERGTATRQRAPLAAVTAAPEDAALVKAFVEARLLVTGDADSHEPLVEVAHEALLRKEGWTRLANWIEKTADDRRLIRRIEREAEEWRRQGKPDFLRPQAEEIQQLQGACERLTVTMTDPLVKDFIEPEQTRLLREIADLKTDHKQRRWIGERLGMIGDPRSGIGLDERGLPQIDWLPVTSGGEIEIEEQRFFVKPFYVARYLVTYRQFQSFLDAPDGFEDKDKRWWRGFPEQYVKLEMSSAVAQYPNYPRDSVSWYQAVAFTLWLDAKYREHRIFGQFPAGDWQVRLPTEWEWQWMAQNGEEAREYPWGEWDKHPRANTAEAGIGDRSTAVGMYPDGRAECGALDVAGNLWEWCLNDREKIGQISIRNNEYKVLRGGSFGPDQYYAAASCRDLYYDPSIRDGSVGFRAVCAPLIASLASEPLDSESE